VAIDPLEFRGVIGHFATGVTVITAAAGDLLQGMTANAFTSLSIDPVMVLICVDKTTYTHGVLERGGAFTVNILGEHQQGVARLFAVHAEPEAGSLRGQSFTIGRTGAPILQDCLAFLECRVAEVLEGGDHSVFMGEVVSQGVVNNVAPLLFYRGAYRALADEA
jgi:flavin reductase (DIM6/NTAB) family NADH-FMN oxidoreductase RutF